MTDTPPRPKRRRWRWIIAGVLLFVFIGISHWRRSSLEPQLILEAQRITVGMSKSEAVRMLSKWRHYYVAVDANGTIAGHFGTVSDTEWKIRSWLNKYVVTPNMRAMNFPVVVEFRDGHVISVRSESN